MTSDLVQTQRESVSTQLLVGAKTLASLFAIIWQLCVVISSLLFGRVCLVVDFAGQLTRSTQLSDKFGRVSSMLPG